MIWTMNVAKETGQDYAVVTYDLAVAFKASSIETFETHCLTMLIMLGNFHIKLAFYGAVGTLINKSEIEFILTEDDILAEGSMAGFIIGEVLQQMYADPLATCQRLGAEVVRTLSPGHT